MKQADNTLGVWQYFMLLLSIFALLLLAAQTFLAADAEMKAVLGTMDNALCAVFFVDFLWQVTHARPLGAYLKWGWLDLLSSIPVLPAFRAARLARIIRIIRVLRGARAAKHMLRIILLQRARSTFGAVVFGALVVLLFSVIAIVNVEPSLAAEDAFWWCLFTLITGDYGDFCPSSTEGRIVTALLMTAGVAVFGTFTASVASFFLEDEQKEDERRDEEILAEVAKLNTQIAEIRKDMMEGPFRERVSQQ